MAEVIQLVKERPEEAFALAKTRQSEARKQQNSEHTPVTSPVIHRKASVVALPSQEALERLNSDEFVHPQVSKFFVLLIWKINHPLILSLLLCS